MNTRIGLLTFGILTCFSTLLVGCGGSSGKQLTEDDFCAQKAGKECNVANTCSVAAMDCQTARKQVCLDWVASIHAVPNTPRVFTAGNVSACISKTDAVYKQSLIKPADLAAVDDVCQYVFQGNVAKLSECTVKYDCKDRGATICDKGHCADKVVKATDQQCSDYGAVCQPAQYCTTVADAKKCVNKKGSGEACDASTPCQDTLRCTGGKCAALVALNGKCCTDDDCAAAAPYCNPYAGFECSTGLSFATHSPSCSAFGDSQATAPTGAATCGGGSDGGAGTGGGTDGAAGADGAASDGAAADSM